MGCDLIMDVFDYRWLLVLSEADHVLVFFLPYAEGSQGLSNILLITGPAMDGVYGMGGFFPWSLERASSLSTGTLGCVVCKRYTWYLPYRPRISLARWVRLWTECFLLSSFLLLSQVLSSFADVWVVSWRFFLRTSKDHGGQQISQMVRKKKKRLETT